MQPFDLCEKCERNSFSCAQHGYLHGKAKVSTGIWDDMGMSRKLNAPTSDGIS